MQLFDHPYLPITPNQMYIYNRIFMKTPVLPVEQMSPGIQFNIFPNGVAYYITL